ncbi:MAG: DUF6398 domain-containing protein [Micrococcales bacterium]|nr:DUF6398 domain-containing protein [Micrococcales bacterium]
MANTGKVPSAMQVHVAEVLAVTDAVCHEHLDAEYADLCALVVGKLARKRPSPLVRGDLRIWAAGVVQAVGQVNFLSDRSQTPHATADELSAWLGVAKSTMAAKAKTVRTLVNMDDAQYMPRELLDSYSALWFVQINGFVVDSRSLPVESQELLAQRGLIPYVYGEPRCTTTR